MGSMMTLEGSPLVDTANIKVEYFKGFHYVCCVSNFQLVSEFFLSSCYLVSVFNCKRDRSLPELDHFHFVLNI